MNINDYKEDLSKGEKGSPCYFTTDSDSSYIDVKRIDTEQYKKEMSELTKHLYAFNDPEMNHDLIFAHWLVNHGVTGWSGIFDGDDELAYSKQTAAKVFLNPEIFMSLNRLLLQHGRDYQNYLHDAANDDVEAIKKS